MTTLEARMAMPVRKPVRDYDEFMAAVAREEENKAIEANKYREYDKLFADIIEEDDQKELEEAHKLNDLYNAHVEANVINNRINTLTKQRKLSASNLIKTLNQYKPSKFDRFKQKAVKLAYRTAAAVPFLVSMTSAVPRPIDPKTEITVGQVPVQDITYSYLTQGFLAYPVKNEEPFINDIVGRRNLPWYIIGTRIHPAEDLKASIGDTIVAPASGRVTRADNYVVEIEGGGLNHQLRHLSQRVKVGDYVRKGQMIGIITTFSSPQGGSHVHYKLTGTDGVFGDQKDPFEAACWYDGPERIQVFANLDKNKATGLQFLNGKDEQESMDQKCALQNISVAYH